MATSTTATTTSRYGLSWNYTTGDDGWGTSSGGFNYAQRMLDALLYCNLISDALTAPPSTPSEGDTYYVPASPTGAWSGKAHTITAYQHGAWEFYPVPKGVRAYFDNHSAFYWFDGTSTWTAEATGGGGGGSLGGEAATDSSIVFLGGEGTGATSTANNSGSVVLAGGGGTGYSTFALSTSAFTPAYVQVYGENLFGDGSGDSAFAGSVTISGMSFLGVTGSTKGGHVRIMGGGTDQGTGGNVLISGGANQDTSIGGSPGGVKITTPNAGQSGSYAIVLHVGSTGQGNKPADLLLQGGDNTENGLPYTGAGGDVRIKGGSATGTSGGAGPGGDIHLETGLHSSAGSARDGLIIFDHCPTADPHVAGAVWSSSGTLMISAG